MVHATTNGSLPFPEIIKNSYGGRDDRKDDRNSLHVTDRRTGMEYDIPIKRNAVMATDFKKIKAVDEHSVASDCAEGGLRIMDPGFNNTTVMESAITFV